VLIEEGVMSGVKLLDNSDVANRNEGLIVRKNKRRLSEINSSDLHFAPLYGRKFVLTIIEELEEVWDITEDRERR